MRSFSIKCLGTEPQLIMYNDVAVIIRAVVRQYGTMHTTIRFESYAGVSTSRNERSECGTSIKQQGFLLLLLLKVTQKMQKSNKKTLKRANERAFWAHKS